MEVNEVLEIDELVTYSILYGTVTILFGFGLLFKFLTFELRLGFRSILSLVLLFIGEPFCQFVIRGHFGFASFAFGCIFIYVTLPASHLDAKDKAVLITGCDSGFGQSLAKRLDSFGMKVFATCLNSNSPGAYALKSTCSSRLHIMQMDVTCPKQVHEAMVYVESELGEEGLWGLINNAGIWYCAEVDMMPWKLFDKVLSVNLQGTIHVTKKFLPLIQRGRGRVIFISSVVGRFPLPHFAAFSTAMAGICSFSESLRHELKKWGALVSVIEPNCFYTESIARRAEVFQCVWDNMNEEDRLKYGRDYFNAIFETYDKLAATFSRDLTPVLRATKSALLSCRPKPRYVTDRYAEICIWLYSSLPSWFGEKLVEMVDVISPVKTKPLALKDQ